MSLISYQRVATAVLKCDGEFRFVIIYRGGSAPGMR